MGFKKSFVSEAFPEAGFLVKGVEIRADAGTGFDFGGSFARAAALALPAGESIGVHAVAALIRKWQKAVWRISRRRPAALGVGQRGGQDFSSGGHWATTETK